MLYSAAAAVFDEFQQTSDNIVVASQSLGGEGFARVFPCLNTPEDQSALWANMDVVDCFATDHAPHTPAEKAAGDGLSPSLAVCEV